METDLIPLFDHLRGAGVPSKLIGYWDRRAGYLMTANGNLSEVFYVTPEKNGGKPKINRAHERRVAEARRLDAILGAEEQLTTDTE